MPKISDEELEQWAAGVPFGSEIGLLARELLTARKVVEAAKFIKAARILADDGPSDWKRLYETITAYDEATHD